MIFVLQKHVIPTSSGYGIGRLIQRIPTAVEIYHKHFEFQRLVVRRPHQFEEPGICLQVISALAVLCRDVMKYTTSSRGQECMKAIGIYLITQNRVLNG